VEVNPPASRITDRSARFYFISVILLLKTVVPVSSW
jgi:hypothetical protein